MRKNTRPSVNLADAQKEFELATAELNASTLALQKAEEKHAHAETRYNSALSALNSSVATLKASNKITIR